MQNQQGLASLYSHWWRNWRCYAWSLMYFCYAMSYKKYLDKKLLYSKWSRSHCSENPRLQKNTDKLASSIKQPKVEIIFYLPTLIKTSHIFRYSSNPSPLKTLSFHCFLFGSKKISNTFSCMISTLIIPYHCNVFLFL